MNDPRKSRTQRERILSYLRDGGSLTPLDALRMFDCFSLSKRISEICGLNILESGEHLRKHLERQTSGKYIMRYWIEISRDNETETGKTNGREEEQ